MSSINDSKYLVKTPVLFIPVSNSIWTLTNLFVLANPLIKLISLTPTVTLYLIIFSISSI
jgi:hypothetical protein